MVRAIPSYRNLVFTGPTFLPTLQGPHTPVSARHHYHAMEDPMTSVTELLADINFAEIGSARGRRPRVPDYVYLRDLNGADLELLKNPPRLGIETPHVARMTNRHHALARLLAEGKKWWECSAITGHSQTRISLLQDDPSFQELIEFYRAQLTTVYLNVHERLAALGISCMEELQERLETEPDTFSARELREIMDTAFNKSVAPDKSTGKNGGGPAQGVNIQINFPTPPNAGAPVLSKPGQLELEAEDQE